MGWQVRVALAGDLAEIDALLARSYPRLVRGDYPPSVLVTALPRLARAQPGLVRSGRYCVVCSDGGQIVGAGGWSAGAGPGGGQIRHFITDDRLVRRGIGRALMDHVLAEARAAGVMRMGCTATRTGVPFYRAMGFAVLGEVTIALAPGIDFPAVEMVRAL